MKKRERELQKAREEQILFLIAKTQKEAMESEITEEDLEDVVLSERFIRRRDALLASLRDDEEWKKRFSTDDSDSSDD
ncbi:MAG TPA: hypothetical protein IAA58_04280 [Candidatus Gallacutalibacter stercoravium]|nr:hypothetical protein [Candidatus Gallacutalibacter stercoravium]